MPSGLTQSTFLKVAKVQHKRICKCLCIADMSQNLQLFFLQKSCVNSTIVLCFIEQKQHFFSCLFFTLALKTKSLVLVCVLLYKPSTHRT